MGSHDTLNSTRNLVTGMILLGGLLLWVMVASLQDPLSAYPARYQVRLPDVSGLAVGNPVRLHGSVCGAVAGLSVAEGQAELTLRLDDSLPLHEGAAVQLRAKTLLGGRYLELVPGDPAARRLLPGERLAAATQPVLPEEVADVLSGLETGAEPLVMIGQARRLLAQAGALRPVLGRLAPVSREALGVWEGLHGLAGELKTLRRAFERLPADEFGRVAGLLERVERVHERLSDIMAALEGAQAYHRGRTGGQAADLTAILERLGTALERAEAGEVHLLTRLEQALERLLLLDEALLRRIVQEEGISPLSPAGARQVRERIRRLEAGDAPPSEVRP